MSDWTVNGVTLLTSAIGAILSGGGVGVLIIYATKKWIGTRIEKGVQSKYDESLADHKAKLTKETDAARVRLEYELKQAAFERELRLTKLHEETATFIAELYSELVAVKNAAKLGAEWIEAVSLVHRSEFTDVENRKKKIHGLFEPKQLYFPREVVALVSAFLTKLDEMVDILPRDLTPDPEGEAQKIEALNAMVSSLDPALEELDKAFRRLLGSDDGLDSRLAAKSR